MVLELEEQDVHELEVELVKQVCKKTLALSNEQKQDLSWNQTGGGSICLSASLLRTLVLISPVLVELWPWRGDAERKDTLPSIRLHAFNLI